jgi:hypothetical protein
MKWSKEQLDDVTEMIFDGKTYAEIGLKYEVSKERIRQIAQKLRIAGLNYAVRRQRKFEELDEYLTLKYGEFYKDGKVNKNDFLTVCKKKFINKRGLNKKSEWGIAFGDIKWNTHCPILGMELDYFAETRQENSPSFDRVDNSKGYVVGNVQIISWRANRIKNDGTAEEHEKIAKYLKSLER